MQLYSSRRGGLPERGGLPGLSFFVVVVVVAVVVVVVFVVVFLLLLGTCCATACCFVFVSTQLDVTFSNIRNNGVDVAEELRVGLRFCVVCRALGPCRSETVTKPTLQQQQ